MLLVDSNILIYAINTFSPKHRTAQNFLQENIGKFAVAHQNIFETIRVLTHPKFSSSMKPRDAIEAVARITKAGRVISPDYKTSHIAIEFIKRHTLSGDQVFDAYLVATALANDIATVATDNVKDFQKFTEILVVNPFETE